MLKIIEMVEKYAGLPKIVIYKKYPYFKNDDDMEQIGLIGLWNAAKTFDESMDIKFVTYASRCIRNAINAELERQSAEKRTLNSSGYCVSLDQPLNQLTGDATVGDVIAAEILYHPIIDFEKILKAKNETHQHIIKLKIQGYDTMYVANHLGVSEQTIRRVWNKVKKEVKECI